MSGTPADAFPKAAFDGIEFFYSEVSVKGGARHALHEFPHAAGAEIEKMGRKPYTITFHAQMHDVPDSDLAREYPDLYPTRLRQLRERFEVELTSDLVVPTVGTIKAMAINWTQRFDAKTPSGESFDLEFIEDQESATLTDVVVELGGTPAILEANDTAQALAAIADFKKQATLGFFQQLNDLVTAFEGIAGQADAFSNLVAGKLEGIANLISTADSTLEELQNPVNHQVVNALKDLWLAARETADNIIETRQSVRQYTVPRVMAIGQVAAEIYGDAQRGVEILQLNAIDDAFAIPAGTVLRYVA